MYFLIMLGYMAKCRTFSLEIASACIQTREFSRKKNEIKYCLNDLRVIFGLASPNLCSIDKKIFDKEIQR